MSKFLALRAAVAALVLLPVVACGPTPAPQPSPVAGLSQGAGTTAVTAAGVLVDDPSGLKTGKVQPLKPPPPPLAASQQASGQDTGQDLAVALNADQELDMYGVALDKGNGLIAQGAGNIVAAGAGNLVAAGAGNYALLETGTVATTTPTPTPTARIEVGASGAVAITTGTPKPTSKPSATPTPRLVRTPVPSLKPKFVPRLDALYSEEKRAKLIAQAQLRNARLTQRATKLVELKGIKAAAKEAAWTSNGDGTVTKKFETAMDKQLGGKNASGHLTVEATVDDASDTMVHHLATVELTLVNTTRVVTREVVIATDGSRHISFHLEETDAQGRRRVVDYDKTIGLEGDLAGTGSATRYDASGKVLRSVSVTLSGEADAPKARAVDANTKLETRVGLDADGVVTAEVRDGATASSGVVTVKPDAAPQDEAATDPAASN